MVTLSIAADFPLGVYTGHGQDGTGERFPGFARLHAALVQSAALGSLSTGDPQAPYSPAVKRALDWLEAHPPDAMSVPDHLPVHTGPSRFAYRWEGVRSKKKGRIKYKSTDRDLSDGTALAGPLRWLWEDPAATPDVEVVDTLTELCADVPHLGETSSPVRLSVDMPTDTTKPTHRRDDDADIRPVQGEVWQELPEPGRREELDRAHAATALCCAPSESDDKASTSALPHAPLPPRTRVSTGVYRPVQAVEADVPWAHVLSLPITESNRPVPEERHVSVCVALHRALAAHLGAGAAPEITGRYGKDTPRPANRVALHLVPGDLPSLPWDDGRDRMVVMIPRGMSGVAVGELAAALGGVRRIVTREHQLSVAPDEVEAHEGDRFWKEPAPGMTRTWEATPAVVPERRVKHREGHRDVDLAAAWSLGNVFRDLVPGLSDRDPVRRAEAVATHGVQLHGRALRTLRPTDYVHRTNRRAPVEPYRLSLTLGDLASERAAVALGQSRHLGCGLLVPVDLPLPAQEIA